MLVKDSVFSRCYNGLRFTFGDGSPSTRDVNMILNNITIGGSGGGGIGLVFEEFSFKKHVNVSILDTLIQSFKSGIYAQGRYLSISMNGSSVYHSSGYAMSVSRCSVITLHNNVFSKNGFVLQATSTRQLSVSGSSFMDNYRGSMRIDVNGMVSALIENCTFGNNRDYSLYLNGNTAKRIDINVLMNKFKSSLADDIIRLQASGSNLQYRIENNDFVDNGVNHVVRVYKNDFAISPIAYILNNRFIGNYNPHQSGHGSVIYIEKRFDVEIHDNEFNNPMMTNIYVPQQLSQDVRDVVNASFNRWECLNASCIHDLITDANDEMFSPYVQVSPFYTPAGEIIQEEYRASQSTKLGERLYTSLKLYRNDSPYTLVKDLTIMPEAVLTIEPGVVIQAANGAGILVLGEMVALGTDDSRITFQSKSINTYWQGIVFGTGGRENESLSTMEYVDIHNSGEEQASIQVVKRNVPIKHLRVYRPGYLNGIEIIHPPGPIVVENSEFTDCKGVGLNIISATPFEPTGSNGRNVYVGPPNLQYGIERICNHAGNELILEKDAIVMETTGRTSTRFTCSRTIRSANGSNIELQILQFNSYGANIHVYKGSGIGNRIAYFVKNSALPRKIVTNSDIVTISVQLNSHYWYYYHGVGSIYLAILLDKQLHDEGK